ncbi:MAG: DUF1579 family protein [Planctomycetes bacterium]|nr:DUF1579 family protein [Planctomycetota bacterium]
MKRTLMLGFVGLLLLGVAGLVPVLSQDMGGSDEAEDACAGEAETTMTGSQDPHGILKKLNGDWSLDFTIWMEPGADPLKMKFDSNTKWALDEQFLTSTYEMKEGPFPHKGIEYYSYNEATKEYEAIRMTSMSGSMIIFHGKYDEKTKSLEMKAEYKMVWGGQTFDVKGRNVYTFESDDKYTFVGYSEYVDVEGMDGELKEVEITATRKKSK